MSDYSLTAQSALSNLQKTFGNTQLRETTDKAILSMATPLAGEQALAAQIDSVYGVAMPKVGKFATSKINNTQLLRIQADQCLVLFDYSGDRAVQAFSKKIDTAYLSDQSDSWVMLHLSGENARAALARICAIDLHPAIFGPGSVTRTAMEHMGVIIICEAENTYTLMALRSFADSFLHAIEVSIENVTE